MKEELNTYGLSSNTEILTDSTLIEHLYTSHKISKAQRNKWLRYGTTSLEVNKKILYYIKHTQRINNRRKADKLTYTKQEKVNIKILENVYSIKPNKALKDFMAMNNPEDTSLLFTLIEDNLSVIEMKKNTRKVK